MDADQYSPYIGQACTHSNPPLPGGYKLDSTTGNYHFQDNTTTNWFKEVLQTGIRHNHNVNLSGGGAHNPYNVSLDYYNQKGTLLSLIHISNEERLSTNGTLQLHERDKSLYIEFAALDYDCLLYTSNPKFNRSEFPNSSPRRQQTDYP